MNTFKHPAKEDAVSSRALAALGLAAVLAACSAVPNTAPRYVEPPPTAPSAKVRVVNLHPFAYYADIAVFDSPTCFTKANLGMTGGNSRDALRIGMMDDKPVSAGTLERHVPIDQPLVIGPRAVFPTVTSSEIMHSLMPDTQDKVRGRQAGVCKIPSFTLAHAAPQPAVRGGGRLDAGTLLGDALPPGGRPRQRQARGRADAALADLDLRIRHEVLQVRRDAGSIAQVARDCSRLACAR